MDIVYISGIVAKTTIGVYKHERNISQTLKIDLELGCNTKAAGYSDDFNDALDYDAVSRRTLEFVEASDYFLIEAVAENLTRLIFQEFKTDYIKLRISKPDAVDIAEDVGVIVERYRPTIE